MEDEMQQHAAKVPYTARDPLHHTHKMSTKFAEIIDHLRRDIAHVDEPKFKAMFETAAEVMGGLVTAFKHYEQKSEAAWNETARKPQ
jgi:hypothetical protein